MPQLYNQRKVEERILETLKVPNPRSCSTPPLEPKQQNAVNENVAATMGRPIVAFPEQDHIAHLKTHLAYMMNPALGMKPAHRAGSTCRPCSTTSRSTSRCGTRQPCLTGRGHTGEDIGDMKEPQGRRGTPAFDRMLAEASQTVVADATSRCSHRCRLSSSRRSR
jgi:hypothetical protein